MSNVVKHEISCPQNEMISQCIIIPRRRDIDLALSVRLFVRPSVTNLLVLYLKDYYRFEHETSEVYRFH